MGLFWKIFVSIGIAMAVTMVARLYVTFGIAAQAWEQVNVEGRDRIIQEVNAALQQGGERELKAWLFKHPRLSGSTVLYVMNEGGQELPGRAIPAELIRLLRTRPMRGPTTPPNLRPMQLTPHLIGPDGKEYRLFFSQAPFTFFGVLIWPGTPIAVSTIALLTAAIGKTTSSVIDVWRKGMKGKGDFTGKVGHTVLIGWEGASSERVIELLLQDETSNDNLIVICDCDLEENAMPGKG